MKVDITSLEWFWIDYTAQEIAEVERVAGLYCIADDDLEAVYIGEAEDVRKRLTQHFTGKGSRKSECIWEHGADQFCYWQIKGGKSARVAWETALLEEFPTPCNNGDDD